jgi:hypothetical protein
MVDNLGGETCVNNEDLNGTRFGQFRCPLNGFPYEAKYCCGEYGKQYCCIREGTRFVFFINNKKMNCFYIVVSYVGLHILVGYFFFY